MNLKKIKSIKNNVLYVDANSLEFIIVKEYEPDAVPIINKLITLADQVNISKIIKYETKPSKIITYEQYIEGVSVEEMIENSQFISWQQLLDYCQQLLVIIECLHDNDILHKDIKPGNIIISNNLLYLIDFNISRMYSQDKNKDTKLIGTEGFASPEQYGFSQTTPASDIFSLGKTFEQLLAITITQPKDYRAFKELVDEMTLLDPNQRLQLKEVETIVSAFTPSDFFSKPKTKYASPVLNFLTNSYFSGVIDTTHGIVWNILASIFFYMYIEAFNYTDIESSFAHYPLILLMATYYLTSIPFQLYLDKISYPYIHQIKNKATKWLVTILIDIVVLATISQLIFDILYLILY